MKVILLDYVYKHGVAGEVIEVADGFARNYLIPKGLAVKATEGELKRARKLREQAAAKRAALDNKMNELAREIDGVELVFGRRAAVTGKLFGSVTTQEIADALFEKSGVDINRRRISQQSLRDIGTHLVPVRLGSEISPDLRVTIVREEEMGEYLAALESNLTPRIVDTHVVIDVPEDVAVEGEAAEAAAVEEMAEEDYAPAAGGDDSIYAEDSGDLPTEVLPRSQVQEEMAAINAQQEAADDDAS